MQELNYKPDTFIFLTQLKIVKQQNEGNQQNIDNNQNYGNQSNSQNKYNQNKPEHISQNLQALIDMGFDKEQSKNVLEATLDNLEDSIEILSVQKAAINQNKPKPPPQPVQQGPDQTNIFLPYMNDALFSQMVAYIQKDPSQITSILQLLQQQNPYFYQLITNNMNDFHYVLQNFKLASEVGNPQNNPQLNQLLSQGNQQLPSQFNVQNLYNTGQVEIDITRNENRFLDKTCKMLGCQKSDVLEAYLICDRNRDQTVNYLFENQGNLLSQNLKEKKINIQVDEVDADSSESDEQPEQNQQKEENKNPDQQDQQTIENCEQQIEQSQDNKQEQNDLNFQNNNVPNDIKIEEKQQNNQQIEQNNENQNENNQKTSQKMEEEEEDDNIFND